MERKIETKHQHSRVDALVMIIYRHRGITVLEFCVVRRCEIHMCVMTENEKLKI